MFGLVVAILRSWRNVFLRKVQLIDHLFFFFFTIIVISSNLRKYIAFNPLFSGHHFIIILCKFRHTSNTLLCTFISRESPTINQWWLSIRSARVIFPQCPLSRRSNFLVICRISFSVTFPISFNLYMTYSDLLQEVVRIRCNISKIIIIIYFSFQFQQKVAFLDHI